MIQNLPALVIVSMLHMLADALSMVPFVGTSLEDLVDNIADGINKTYVNTQVISTGITANVTGSTASDKPADVSSAVAILNATVQSSSQPPQTVIVTSTQNVDIPTGCRTVVANVFGAGAGGARGPSVGGAGAAGGGGGIGGWQKDVPLLASSLPATLRCVIGTHGTGATSDNKAGTDGGTSAITNVAGTTTYLQATGGKGGKPIPQNTSGASAFAAYNGDPGSGAGVASLNGTSGGYGGGGTGQAVTGQNGAAGSSVAGGTGGTSEGQAGGDGEDETSTLIPGMGGSGGGGNHAAQFGSAGKGGKGGYPGGGGGGGGMFYISGTNGNGGDGNDGEIWLTFVF